MIAISNQEIENGLITAAEKGMSALFERVPFARVFHLGQETNLAYFRRHLIETVVRMKLDIQTDAYALYKMRPFDNDLSRKFAQYLSEEAGHDEMFLADIKRFGIDRDEALATKPFNSTENLIGLFYYNLNHVGPMMTVLWGWLVEWYSDNYNGKITQKAADEFGAEKVKGSFAHLAVDDLKDHHAFMLSTIAILINNENDLLAAQQMVARLIDLLADYFNELYEMTIKEERQAA